jgi:hypothetical protein
MKYKIGDRVRIIAKGSNCSYHEVGNVGTVIQDDDMSSIPYQIKIDGSDNYYWAISNELEPVSERGTSESSDPPSFHVGQRVRVTKNCAIDEWIGKTVTITSIEDFKIYSQDDKGGKMGWMTPDRFAPIEETKPFSQGQHDFYSDDELDILTNPDGSKRGPPEHNTNECSSDFCGYEPVSGSQVKRSEGGIRVWVRYKPNQPFVPIDNLDKLRGAQVDAVYFDEVINNGSVKPKAESDRKGKPMNVIKKLKDLTLSKETRILRENGLEDECGMTSDSRQMMMDELVEERWATRREAIAADLLKIKEEEK